MKMDTMIRRYFAFNRLYFEVWRNLPSPEQKCLFMQAIAMYGFEHTEPDFTADPVLQQAWNSIFADLSFSWGQREQGSHGGNMSALSKSAKEKRKAKKPDDSDTSIETKENSNQPFPANGDPKPEFMDFLRKNSLYRLASAPKPLTGEQMRWFFNQCGEVLANSLVKNFNSYLDRQDTEKFWAMPEYKDKSAGDLIYRSYQVAKESFDSWLSVTFPNVAAMGNRSLTFAQYHLLRFNYGRGNVLIKLKQLDSKKSIYKNATAYATLDNWIKSSIEKPSNSKYKLESYDDDPAHAVLSCVQSGYDDLFNFALYPPFAY